MLKTIKICLLKVRSTAQGKQRTARELNAVKAKTAATTKYLGYAKAKANENIYLCSYIFKVYILLFLLNNHIFFIYIF